MELYKHEVNFQKIIRHIWALAYVPLDQVIPVCETIIQEVRIGCLQWEDDFGPQLASFFKYVDATWIGELNPRTRIRKNPVYSHDLWNKFKAVLDGDHRTNNIVEGFNHGFSLSLPSRATEWSVIKRFRVEEAMAKVALHQAAMRNTGQSHNTSMNLKRQDREEKLRSVVSNFSNMSVQSYMESICSFFD
jgi:hypothetical protein